MRQSPRPLCLPAAIYLPMCLILCNTGVPLPPAYITHLGNQENVLGVFVYDNSSEEKNPLAPPSLQLQTHEPQSPQREHDDPGPIEQNVS